MQHNDDIAFQRAILVNPADTTLKLVYADWLQERGDPRAEFVRLQLKIDEWKEVDSEVGRWERQIPLRELSVTLDPGWVGFMESLAQPFERSWFSSEGDPFTECVGKRGEVMVFESQYRTAENFTEELTADLAFLTNIRWGESSGRDEGTIQSFLCDIRSEGHQPTAAEIRTALKMAFFRRDSSLRSGIGRFGTRLGDQFLFSHEEGGEEPDWRRRELERYVAGGHVWYLTLPVEGILSNTEGDYFQVGIAVGRSPLGNRLVGAMACQLFNHYC